MTRARWHLSVLVLAGWALAAPLVASGAPPILEAIETGGLETRAAALILSGQQGGALEVDVFALPLLGGGARSRVALVVEIAAAPLLETKRQASEDDSANPEAIDKETASGANAEKDAESEVAESIGLEIYVYALDAREGVGAYLAQAFTVERQALAGGHPVTFLGRLELHPGDYSLRLLVLQRRLDRFALESAPLRVPAEDDSGQELPLPPFFLAPTEERVLVRQAGLAEGNLPFPIQIEEGWRVPRPRPSFAAVGNEPFLWPRPPGATEALHLTAKDGEPLEGSLTLGEPTATLGGYPLHVGHLDTASLLAGEYRLTSGDRGFAGTASPFRIHREVRELAELPPTTAPPRGISRAYAEGLSLLAAGDTRAAQARIIQLERRHLRAGNFKQQKALLEAELQLASQLGARNPEGLLPLLVAHEELYRHHHRRKQYQLATHSRQLVVELAALTRALDASPAVAETIAQALVSMAGYLQEVGAALEAQPVLRSALESQSNHPAALLALGVIHETYGEHEEAAQIFRALVEAHPGHEEGALRLALNLRRTGDLREARALLEARLEAGAEWLRVLAHQELADLLAKNDLEAATDLLATAIERFPEYPRFAFQRAAFLDRLGHSARALEQLEGVDTRLSRQAPSPRLRYSRWPRQNIEQARLALASSIEEHRSALADALDSSGLGPSQEQRGR